MTSSDNTARFQFMKEALSCDSFFIKITINFDGRMLFDFDGITGLMPADKIAFVMITEWYARSTMNDLYFAIETKECVIVES